MRDVQFVRVAALRKAAMSNSSISLTASDIIGAIQRGLFEMDMHLKGHPLAINVPASKQHIERLGALFDTLEDMQLSMHSASQSASNGAEDRAN